MLSPCRGPVDILHGVPRNGGMCSRIDQSASPVGGFLGALDLPPPRDYRASGNVRPTDPVLAVRTADTMDVLFRMEAVALRWGFKGHTNAPIINARAETAHYLPMFREAFRHQRCIVPVARFYEWTAAPCEPGEPDLLGDPAPAAARARKQPHAFAMPDGAAYALAGLWRADRLVILTVAASPAVAAYHDRMPAILPPEHVRQWLSLDHSQGEFIHPLLVPFEGPLVAAPVAVFPS